MVYFSSFTQVIIIIGFMGLIQLNHKDYSVKVCAENNYIDVANKSLIEHSTTKLT